MHGAPIFSALAAEASGADLIYVCLPDWHENAAKEASLNFQVHPFTSGNDLCPEDTKEILELLATMDACVIGPGIDHANKESIEAVFEMIEGAGCALILDAAALQPKTLKLIKGKTAVLTPHLGELERMGIKEQDLQKEADKSGAVIILKGRTDNIFGPGKKHEKSSGGNAGLTVGGTGDALAGLIAGLIAQKTNPFTAALNASAIVKASAEILEKEKGYAFTAKDVINEIPKTMLKIGI